MKSLQQISAWFRNINLFNDDFPDTRIPSALINDENNLLEESVETKVKELESIQLNIDEHSDRIEMLEDHHKIVQDEIRIIQVFIQYETIKKIEQQLMYLCVATNDDNAIHAFEQLSADQGVKIILKSYYTQSKKTTRET